MPSPLEPPAGGAPVTLLHVSDPQFGRHHQFARSDLSRIGWDAPFETLLDALRQDLQALREEYGLKPDLLIVTGDLAEWGLPEEFEDALRFVRGLAGHLDLSARRIAVIPGNHDIHRQLCEDYFAACAASGSEPAYPYWPKWEPYVDFFRTLYGDIPSYRFTPELPWTLFPIESLRIVVAGLNSTLQESHREVDHYGWVGSRQLAWFAEELARYRRDGWLRIGAVHHNFFRGAALDDENLRDADPLREALSGSLNLLLHGHTHHAKLGWIHPGLPVLSTGSAALGPGQRPSEVPNQYEVIELWPDRIRRWTRCFALDRKRWIADTRSSDDGNRWWDEQPVRFDSIGATFPAATQQPAGPGAEAAGLATPRKAEPSPGGSGEAGEEPAGLERTSDGPIRAEPLSPPVPLVEANPAAATLFVGRDAELAQLAAALLGPAVRPAAIVGMPGVGKSYLADRFALLYPEAFPGGVYRVVLDPESPPASVAPLLGELADRLQVPPEPAAGLAERLRVRLLAPHSLLHVENADGQEAGRAAADLVRLLPGCPVIVSARLQSLGRSAGWERVELRWFSQTEALAQLQEELGKEKDRVPAADRERLVRELAGLPLALHLAAGYLLAGQTAAGFLAELRTAGLDLQAADPADPMVAARQGRELLAGTLRASVRLLDRQSAGAGLAAALRRLGFASASGFGASLGAALAGLSGDAFQVLAGNATRLSLLAPAESRERKNPAWRLHPLLAEVLRAEAGDAERAAAQQRSTEWFLDRLPEERQGPAWHELGEETEALTAWLAAVPAEDRVRVERAGSWYAMLNGPFHAWRAFCEQALAGALEAADRSRFLWTLGRVAWRGGALDQALAVAAEKEELDRARGEEREAALAAGLRADVLQARGELEEALRIRREEELPVYERLDDVRERAVTLGRIADVLQARGELEEALRIRREEQLPVYERLDDVRERAVALGKIADVLQARGELEESLRIRREEELPVYERLGDVSSRAVTLGKIADVLQARGELEEALRIYQEEELPVYERLAGRQDVMMCQARIALLRLRRDASGDREEAARLLQLARSAAEAMRIPEAEIHRMIHRRGLGRLPSPSLPGKAAE
jgi:3',5'-cyclic AMP phosphodiesterase CpdA/tetratricopeptide (TPR) repeat protein